MVNRLRLIREAKAIAFLKRQRFATSAFEIGNAALSGEARASAIPPNAKEAIGLSIGVELVRRKLVKVTRENRFYRATMGNRSLSVGSAEQAASKRASHSAVASERLAVGHR
jgi:hypothetical protein